MSGTREDLEEAVNASCERQLRDFLRSQVRELDALGFSEIPFAFMVRQCLERLDDRRAPRGRAGGRPVLRVVTPVGPAA